MSKPASGEAGLLRLADATRESLALNARTIARGKASPNHPHVVAWFLPVVTHALKGGVRTVFMLAENFTKSWGTLNHFVIYSHSGVDVDTSGLVASLSKNFPELRFLVQVHRRGKDDIESLPRSNLAFCTLWTTAYLLARYNDTRAKYYLMQDFEPSFYAAGSVYGAIEQTYRLGFSCIANTPGVGNRYRQYSDDIVSFLPGVDTEMFHPDPDKVQPGTPRKVVFYGRPSNARNCFDLGVQTLIELKRRMGEGVEIVSVGERWSAADNGLEGVVQNLGLLDSLEDVAALYRQADLGLVFMTTPHPSYQPLEYMASGCVAATNINEANSWLINDRNALAVEPIPSLAADRIQDLLNDLPKWTSVRDEGLMTVERLSWENAFEVVRQRILRG